MEQPSSINPRAVTDTKPLHPGPPQVKACGDFVLGGEGEPTHWLIDGFNLYHSLVSCEKTCGAPLRWLNPMELAERCSHLVSPRSRVEKVSFFTSVPSHLGPEEPDKLSRHRLYVRALSAWRPPCAVKFGHFQAMQSGGRAYWAEKGVDVALAAEVFASCLRGEVRHVVIVSGDSDLFPVAELVRNCFPCVDLHFAFPANRVSRRLKASGSHCFTLSIEHYQASQFPKSIRLPSGRLLHCPAQWMPRPG